MAKDMGRGVRGRGRTWATGILLLCSGAAVAVGCSGRGFDDVDSLMPKAASEAAKVAPVERTVGAQGGAVTSADGSGVEIPADAVPNDVDVSVAPATDVAAPPATEQVGDAYTLGPAGIQFAVPVTVVLSFDPARLPAGKSAADIVILTAPDGTTAFERLPTQQRDATHVTAETTHFSHFVPAILTPEYVDHPRPTCVAITCKGESIECGRHDDGCGHEIDCGKCSTEIPDAGTEPVGTKEPGEGADASVPPPKVDAGVEPKSDAGPPKGDAGPDPKGDAGPPPKGDAGPDPKADGGACTPFFCGHYGPGACGVLKDGCGAPLECGPCPVEPMDGGKPDPGGPVAGADAGACMALTCTNYPKTCGPAKDGCGGELQCFGGCPNGPSDAGEPPMHPGKDASGPEAHGK